MGKRGRKLRDLTGERFGSLTAIRFVGMRQCGNSTKAVWLWRCDCGNEKEIVGNNVTEGTTRSCGCHQTEWRRKGFADRGREARKRKALLTASTKREIHLDPKCYKKDEWMFGDKKDVDRLRRMFNF